MDSYFCPYAYSSNRNGLRNKRYHLRIKDSLDTPLGVPNFPGPTVQTEYVLTTYPVTQSPYIYCPCRSGSRQPRQTGPPITALPSLLLQAKIGRTSVSTNTLIIQTSASTNTLIIQWNLLEGRSLLANKIQSHKIQIRFDTGSIIEGKGRPHKFGPLDIRIDRQHGRIVQKDIRFCHKTTSLKVQRRFLSIQIRLQWRYIGSSATKMSSVCVICSAL